MTARKTKGFSVNDVSSYSILIFFFLI